MERIIPAGVLLAVPFSIAGAAALFYRLPMHHESVRAFCLKLPHATERIQWGNDLLLCVGNKMFAVLVLDAASPYRLTFKCTPEEFAELTEREAIDPAPYVARYHWVTLRSFDAVAPAELQRLLRDSYQMVFDKLPRKVKDSLANAALGRKAPARRLRQKKGRAL